MKKILLIVAVASLAMVSCKKDRDCSCKTVVTQTGPDIMDPTKIVTTQTVSDHNYTMTETGRKAAFRHCTHKKGTQTSGKYTYEIDQNCELK